MNKNQGINAEHVLVRDMSVFSAGLVFPEVIKLPVVDFRLFAVINKKAIYCLYMHLVQL